MKRAGPMLREWLRRLGGAVGDSARPAPPGRIPTLDLLRFLAAISVVLFHFGHRGFTHERLQLVRFPALSPVARYGYLGLYLFFMISGFVISMSAHGRSPAAFFKSRFLRLYPAYWAAATLTFLAIPRLGATHLVRTFDQWLVNLTMLQGLYGVPDVDGVYWTLLVELRFYWLVFLVCLAGLFDALPLLLTLWTGYLYLALRKVIVPDPAAISPLGAYFIAGAAFYLVYRGKSRVQGLLIVALSGYLVFQHCTEDAKGQLLAFDAPVSPAIAASIVGSFFVVFALLALRKLDWLSRPWFFTLGALTYPLYLTHQFLGYALLNRFATGAFPYAWLVLVVTFLLALAWALHRFIEVPVSRLLARLFEDRSGAEPKRQHPG